MSVRKNGALLTWVLRVYTYGDVTSRNQWPRYNRHFVGITWYNVMYGVKGRRFIMLFIQHSIRWFMKMSV